MLYKDDLTAAYEQIGVLKKELENKKENRDELSKDLVMKKTWKIVKTISLYLLLVGVFGSLGFGAFKWCNYSNKLERQRITACFDSCKKEYRDFVAVSAYENGVVLICDCVLRKGTERINISNPTN